MNQVPTAIRTRPPQRLTADPVILRGRRVSAWTDDTTNAPVMSNTVNTAAAMAKAHIVVRALTVTV